MKYLAKLLIAAAFALIAFARVDGIDMTEGQILLNYFPYLLLAVGCLVGAMVILSNQKDDQA